MFSTHTMTTNTSISLSALQRQEIIDEYMDCWIDTHSFSLNEEAADEEADDMRTNLNSLSDSELYEEVKCSGWDIRIHI
jgi:hypothetical protein